MLIQPSSSGAERNATAFSALTRGTAGWMGAASGGCGICGCTTGAAGWTMEVSKAGAGAGSSGWGASLAKKSAAAVTTGSATMGGGVGLGAGRSGSCPKVPPGPTISGSMGSLPPSERAVWSGPRSTSKAARGRATLTRTGVMGGVAGSGWAGAAGAASVSAASASISCVTLCPQRSTPDIQSGTPRCSPAGSSSSSSGSSSVSSYSSSISRSACRMAARSARRAALCSAKAEPRARRPPVTAHSQTQTSAGVISKMYRLPHNKSTIIMRFAAGRPHSKSSTPPSTKPIAPPESHALTPLA